MADVTFRPAEEADLERLIEVHTSAFPDPRGRDARHRNFTANALARLDDLVVAERGGVLVGHGFLSALEVHVAGRIVPVGGVATLGVAPEARGAGVGGALLARLHAISEARGDALTMLYAFRHGYYARHGYGPTRPYQRLAFAPESVPRAWRRPGVRAATAADAQAIEALWERGARRGVGALARPASLWLRLHLDERRVTLLAERGYVAWELAQAEPHAETRMLVHELVAEDDDTARALLAAIGAQAGQVRAVELALPWDAPLAMALVDADRARPGTAHVEHALGAIVAGPMLRVADVRRAVELRALDAPLTVECEGTRVDVRGGGPLLRAGRGALASVLYGGLLPSEARALDLAAGDAPDDPFRLPAFFNPDPF